MNNMSELNLGRPLYHNKDMTLVDIISEKVYYGYKEIKDNIAHTVSKAYNRTVGNVTDEFKNNKNALPYTLGGLASLTVNLFVTDYATKHGYSLDEVKKISYCAELVTTTIASLIIYGLDANTKGRENGTYGKAYWKNTLELGKSAILAFAVSVGPYRLARNLGSDAFMHLGMQAKYAMPLIQGMLLAPFVIAVRKANDAVAYIGENIAYFRANPGSLNVSVRRRKEAVVLRLSTIGEIVKDKMRA